MLVELEKLDYPGNREDILFFLQSVVGSKFLTIDEIRVICTHAPGKYQLVVDSLIQYCCCFHWLKYDDNIRIDEKILHLIGSSEELNYELVVSTIDALFTHEIFTSVLFLYDFNKKQFTFRNELLPLCFSSIRNVLVSQGFFKVEKESVTVFYINPRYENIITIFCKSKKVSFTLEQLKKKLENDARAGEIAEHYVLKYEQKRLLNNPYNKNIRIISDIDVSAGYDIVSFDTDLSYVYDRFIEVKSVSESLDFFWSSNETNISKIKGSQYYIYLIELSKIYDINYNPIIIPNPAKTILDSTEWIVEAQTFHIKPL